MEGALRRGSRVVINDDAKLYRGLQFSGYVILWCCPKGRLLALLAVWNPRLEVLAFRFGRVALRVRHT
jgi:hypothetical protein